MTKVSSSSVVTWVIVGLFVRGAYCGCLEWYPELGLPTATEAFTAFVRGCEAVGESGVWFPFFAIAGVIAGGIALFRGEMDKRER